MHIHSDEPTSKNTEKLPKLPCIGIDIGTTTISIIVLDADSGNTTEVINIPNASDIPSDKTWEKKQDANRITKKILDILESLSHKYPKIRSIGLTGQMHGILYTDTDGNAVSPLYTWQDESAGQGSPTPCEILRERTGYSLSPGYGLATHFAHVLARCVPDNAAKICTVMDYLVMKLTGRTTPVMHASNAASLGLYDIAKHAFDTDAVVRAGIDPSILPEVTSESAVVGSWHGIAVTVAIGDNQASFLGSVRDPEHSALANFGTGSQISLLTHSAENIPTNASLEIRPFLENSLLASGSALCGGRAYAILERFFRSYITACGISETEQYEVMNRLAAKSLESGKYLHVHTQFCGTRNDPSLRGSISGISEELFTPEAMIAGTLWGMASELYDMFREMPHSHISTLVVSGNAVRKNPSFQQMLKEVFGMNVSVPVHREEAAFGAALFAAKIADVCENSENLASCIQYTNDSCSTAS